MRYLALIRGINVGGRNIVPMTDLRAAFQACGHQEVNTYIQSGNVMFESKRPHSALGQDLEQALESRFGVALVVVVLSHQRLRRVVDGAPDGFGTEPGIYHSDAIFLRPPLSSSQAMGVVVLREGVDRAWPGEGVVYFERLSARRTQTRMGRIVGTPEYKQMTIRSWTTTTRLLRLLDAQESGSASSL